MSEYDPYRYEVIIPGDGIKGMERLPDRKTAPGYLFARSGVLSEAMRQCNLQRRDTKAFVFDTLTGETVF